MAFTWVLPHVGIGNGCSSPEKEIQGEFIGKIGALQSWMGNWLKV